MFAPGATAASRVYGQFGSFITGYTNNNGMGGANANPSASNLNGPSGVAVDVSGGNKLYVADSS